METYIEQQIPASSDLFNNFDDEKVKNDNTKFKKVFGFYIFIIITVITSAVTFLGFSNLPPSETKDNDNQLGMFNNLDKKANVAGAKTQKQVMEESPTLTVTGTATPSSSPTLAPTSEPTQTPTSEPTATQTPTPETTNTPTPEPTLEPTPEITNSPTPTIEEFQETD